MKPGRWGSYRHTTHLQTPWHLPVELRLYILALAFAMVLAPFRCVAETGAPVLQLDRADFVPSDASEPPPDTAAWTPQRLPDNWLVSGAGAQGYGWYRVQFDLPRDPDQLYAAFMPLLETFGALYVNGVYVGQTGDFELISRAEQGSQPFSQGAPPVLLRISASAVLDSPRPC